MAARIITEAALTFGDFSLLPGYTPRDCKITDITLETALAGVSLHIPMLSAAMTSVTSYDLAIALGSEGGLPVLPARLAIEEQAEIVRRVKSYEAGFVEEPTTVRPSTTIEKTLSRIERYGHSKIPVTDRNNRFLGLFYHKNYLENPVDPQRPVSEAMSHFAEGGKIPYVKKPGITLTQAQKEMGDNSYLVILDQHGRLEKLAFQKDMERLKVAAAIATHSGWQKRTQALVEAGVDMVVIDTSDAYSEFVKEVVVEYGKMKRTMPREVPLCVGNVVTYEAALDLMRWGVDVVKVGMSSGSICTTQREKAVGRAPMTALIEVDNARKVYQTQSGKYVPIIMDGGISTPADMVIALAVADALMMGGYFNHFLEAAGEKYDSRGNQTRIEREMEMVATWGEGSARARNLGRYGHAGPATFFTEGEEGRVPYWGRLKPRLKVDLMKIRGAMSNTGSRSLGEYRANAVLEVMSPYARAVVGDTHHIQVKGM